MEKLAAAETEVEELKNKQEDLEYSLDNATSKVEKLDRYLCEAYQKLHTLEEGKVTVEGGGEGVSKKKVHHFYQAILHWSFFGTVLLFNTIITTKLSL